MSPSPPDHGRSTLEERLNNLEEELELRGRQLGRAQAEAERLRIERDQTLLEREIAVLKHELKEATAPPAQLPTAHATPSTMRWPFIGALLAIALLVSAGIVVPRLRAPQPHAPPPSSVRPPTNMVPPARAEAATQQSPLPRPEQFPVVIGWSGGGLNSASFWVQVKNTTGQDAYVKSLELRGLQGSKCGLVPRFPELVPPHPFVRANDVRAVIPELEFNGVTQRELTLCEIKAIAVVVMSPTYPAPESPQNFVVSESRALGN